MLTKYLSFRLSLTVYSPLFSVRSSMSIVEFDGPPSWSLGVSETGRVQNALPVGILFSTKFCSHQETKMAACGTQRSTSTISHVLSYFFHQAAL